MLAGLVEHAGPLLVCAIVSLHLLHHVVHVLLFAQVDGKAACIAILSRLLELLRARHDEFVQLRLS